jgi:hypothetical protein
MAFQSANFENFGTPNLGVSRQNEIWMQPPWLITKNTKKGEGGGFPQIQVVVNIVSPYMFVACSCTKNVPTTH